MNNKNVKRAKRAKQNVEEKKSKINRNFIILIFTILIVAATMVIVSVRVFDNQNKFPYSTGGYNSLKKMDMLGNNLFLLTNEDSIVLSPSGSEKQKIKHGYSRPFAVVNKNNALVYDLNGSSFYVQNAKNQIYTGKINERIIAGAIDRNSNIALATSSKDSLMKLSVYKKSFTKKVFEWMTYSSVIVDTSLSGQNTVAVAVYDSKNYRSLSKVLIFDFSKSKPIATFEFPGSAVLSVKYTTPNTLVVILDNKTVGITNNKKISSEFKYGSQFLSGFSFDDSKGVNLVLSSGKNSNKNKLVGLNSRGKAISEKNFDHNVVSVYSANSKTYLLTNDELYQYYKVGKPKSEKLETQATQVVGNNQGAYVYSYGRIYKVR